VERAAGAIRELGGQLSGIEPVDSHGPLGQRTAVVVTKASETPARYPRKPKQVAKRPL